MVSAEELMLVLSPRSNGNGDVTSKMIEINLHFLNENSNAS